MRLTGVLGESGFVIYDVGTADCTVGGRASVQILDAAGSPLALQIEPWETDMDGPGLLLLAGQPTPAPGQGIYPSWAGVQLAWSNWCGPAWTSGTLVVSFPVVGELRAPLAGFPAPTCTDPSKPSTLVVGPLITPR